jgi:hypothetical protein
MKLAGKNRARQRLPELEEAQCGGEDSAALMG